MRWKKLRSNSFSIIRDTSLCTDFGNLIKNEILSSLSDMSYQKSDSSDVVAISYKTNGISAFARSHAIDNP